MFVDLLCTWLANYLGPGISQMNSDLMHIEDS